jgi:hypothetical protein
MTRRAARPPKAEEGGSGSSTAAMRLLHADVDTTVIALWLGHEQVETTQMYLHADLDIKERALARTKPLDSKPGRYGPPDALLGFLDGLWPSWVRSAPTSCPRWPQRGVTADPAFGEWQGDLVGWCADLLFRRPAHGAAAGPRRPA